MIDKDIQIISEKLESLHSKILKSKFAEALTEESKQKALKYLEDRKKQLDKENIKYENM